VEPARPPSSVVRSRDEVGTTCSTENRLGREGDVDKAAKVLHVRRLLVGGNLRPYGKTAGALRVVPLAQRAPDALEAHPARIGTPTLFTTKQARPSTCTAGGLATGRRHSARHALSTAGRTRCATPSRRGRSPRASPRSRSRRRWGRASSSCRRRTRTFCRTRVALDAFLAASDETFGHGAGTSEATDGSHLNERNRRFAAVSVSRGAEIRTRDL
jgi:hypothetical protein